MLKKVLKASLSSVRTGAYKAEYYYEAVSKHISHKLRGGTPDRRLMHYSTAVFNRGSSVDSARLALFVAYHPGLPVPESNRCYLKALQACGFRIVYIHNGSLSADAVESLSCFCERVFCRENIGQDFGAWKDGYLYARTNNLLEGVEWLLFCNDSNFFVGGPNGEKFVQIFSSELASSRADLIALNKNYELWQHFQSYFLCFRRQVWQSQKFVKFWEEYLPLSHRYHVINNGEIALTRNVLSAASARILYCSSELIRNPSSYASRPTEFYALFPQGALYLGESRGLVDDFPLSLHRIQQAFSLLDCHNPSHAYALLFARYLESPFLKRDLLRQGIFSMPQIRLLLELLKLEAENPCLFFEIVSAYEAGGTNMSYLRYPKEAFRKGINPRLTLVAGHGSAALAALGLGPMQS